MKNELLFTMLLPLSMIFNFSPEKLYGIEIVSCITEHNTQYPSVVTITFKSHFNTAANTLADVETTLRLPGQPGLNNINTSVSNKTQTIHGVVVQAATQTHQSVIVYRNTFNGISVINANQAIVAVCKKAGRQICDDDIVITEIKDQTLKIRSREYPSTVYQIELVLNKYGQLSISRYEKKANSR